MSFVGKSIPHDSARGHVAGESIFIDDVLPARNELFIEIVGAPVAHGKLKSVNVKDARQAPGVVAVLTARDIPGHHHFGPVIQDEHLLVEDEIFYLGDPVVLIAADTREAARDAKKLVRIEVEPLKPIFTIDEAIAAQSFIGGQRKIETGNLEDAFASSQHTLDGVFEIGGQEHFYLESQAAIAIPGEAGQIVVHSSTQHPSEVQAIVAEILGIPFNHVTVICKRMGGGFGGKETQAAAPAAMAALVASITRRPARIVLDRDTDMTITGKRHPFKNFWKVAFDAEGRINALSIDHYSNGGCTTDLSFAVLERALLHSDNAYFIPNAKFTGRICKTNLPSNTAFRGFGGPQGVAAIENIIEEIARYLNIDALEIRKRNCYGIKSRNITPYGQIVGNNTLPQVFETLEKSSDYERRRNEIDAFNASSASYLRGLSMTAVKFGISFTRRTLNQANALVNVYLDGTVMVSTGATEMGQGVNTRVRQIVADELGIDYANVIVSATSTDKNNNTSPTAASSGTDLNGAAAADACARIRDRMKAHLATVLCDAKAGIAPEPAHIAMQHGEVFDVRQPDNRITFKKAVQLCYEARISLGERGFYATPGVDFNRETGKGNPFLYYTNGAAVSEVLIDRFTGEMKVTRVDLLMDLGRAINPSMDMGQVIGGFIQGMGWVSTEQLCYNAHGELLSHSPTTYKIPNIGDVPKVFNSATLDNPNSNLSIKGSKAMGEPPLLLGLSVWAACKNALSYLSNGRAATLHIPATGENLLLTMTALKKASAIPAVSVK
jgi:xanthine dehydrogenase large subunit